MSHFLRSGKPFKEFSNSNSNLDNEETENLSSSSSQYSSIESNLSISDLQSNNNLYNTMTNLNCELALKIIPEFNGENSHDLERFISCCEIVETPLSAAEKLKFLKLLNVKLSGKAHDVLRFNTFDTFDNLKAELIAQFGESRSIETLSVELMDVRQERDETVRSYANRVEKILSMLDSACVLREGNAAAQTIRNLNSGRALKSFQEGLRDPIKLLIKASRFPTLKEAINGAIEEEAVLAHTNCKGNSVQTNNSNKPNQQVKCNFCQKTGHIASSCFKKQNQSRLNPQVNNPNFKFNSSSHDNTHLKKINKFCNYCKNSGHVIDECRKRQRNNSIKSNSQQKPEQTASTNIVSSGNLNPLDLKNVNATLRVMDL